MCVSVCVRARGTSDEHVWYNASNMFERIVLKHDKCHACVIVRIRLHQRMLPGMWHGVSHYRDTTDRVCTCGYMTGSTALERSHSHK